MKTKAISKTVWLAILSIMSVLLAFMVSSQSTLINLENIKIKELRDNKQPVYYQVGSEINKIDLRISDKAKSEVSVNIKFDSQVNPVDKTGNQNIKQQNIKIEQPLNKNDLNMKSNHDEFDDIDLNQVAWELVDDTLIIDLSKAFEQTKSYYGEELELTLSSKEWQIVTNSEKLRVLTMDEPINLDIRAMLADISGDYKNLTIHQTAECNVYDNYDGCFSFDQASIDKLMIYSKLESEPLKPENEKDNDVKDNDVKDKSSLTSSLRFRQNVQVNTVDLYMPKTVKVELYDLSLLNKINWHEPLQQSPDKK